MRQRFPTFVVSLFVSLACSNTYFDTIDVSMVAIAFSFVYANDLI